MLLVPGIGTVDDLRSAREAGAVGGPDRHALHRGRRLDPALRRWPATLGMETVGFLMMSHRTSPEELAKQARIMVDAGCAVRLRRRLGRRARPHRGAGADRGAGRRASAARRRSASTATRTSRSASPTRCSPSESGARQIDGSLCALGAGAGNSPTEVLAATFDRLGIETGVDVGGVLDAAEEVVRPFLPRWPKADRTAIVQG